ncbi:hypothetical protein [Brucella sp. LJL56]
MPPKHNAARRHTTPRQQFKVTNWPTCEAGLRQRSSITFWLSEDAISRWYADRRRMPGGQPPYSDLAIEAADVQSGLRSTFTADRRADGFAVCVDGRRSAGA